MLRVLCVFLIVQANWSVFAAERTDRQWVMPGFRRFFNKENEVPVLAPTTLPPATMAPITLTPTTEAPITEAPITQAPPTEAPITEAPITKAPVTEAPTTEAPTTESPTTEAPTTKAPSTKAPSTDTPPLTPSPNTIIFTPRPKSRKKARGAQDDDTSAKDSSSGFFSQVNIIWILAGALGLLFLIALLVICHLRGKRQDSMDEEYLPYQPKVKGPKIVTSPPSYNMGNRYSTLSSAGARNSYAPRTSYDTYRGQSEVSDFNEPSPFGHTEGSQEWTMATKKPRGNTTSRESYEL